MEAATQLVGSTAQKTWNVQSPNPRPEHALIDGETVGIDETFSNGANWPGDPVLGAEGVANCTCGVTISFNPQPSFPLGHSVEWPFFHARKVLICKAKLRRRDQSRWPRRRAEDGQFMGYASVFGNVDSYGDVVVKVLSPRHSKNGTHRAT